MDRRASAAKEAIATGDRDEVDYRQKRLQEATDLRDRYARWIDWIATMEGK